MSHLASNVEDLRLQLTSKQDEIEKQGDKLSKLERIADSAKRDAGITANITISVQDRLRCAKLQNEKLDLKLRESHDELADSQISLHKTKTAKDSLQIGER